MVLGAHGSGWLNQPTLKNMLVKLDHWSPRLGMNIKDKGKPPPRKWILETKPSSGSLSSAPPTRKKRDVDIQRPLKIFPTTKIFRKQYNLCRLQSHLLGRNWLFWFQEVVDRESFGRGWRPWKASDYFTKQGWLPPSLPPGVWWFKTPPKKKKA